MELYINLAPKLTGLLTSTRELVGVEALTSGGPRCSVDGIEVRVYGSNIFLKGGKNGKFTYYRHTSPPALYKREYIGPRPNNYETIYPNAEEVHLIYIEGKGRVDKFTEIPFP